MKRLNKIFLATILLVAFLMPISVQASIESGNGIDVSDFQDVYNYQQVANSGIKYTYIKATEAIWHTQTDYLNKWEGFKNVGIKVGFYHFFRTQYDPIQQAEHFYDMIKDYNYNLIPMLDVETNDNKLSAQALSAEVIQFANRFKELSGQDIVIYTGSYFERENFTQQIIQNYKMWIAHYYVDTPTVAAGTNLVGHQFSENYLVSGVGYVDGDIFTNAIELNTSVSNVLNSNTTNYSTVASFDQYKQYREYVGSRCKELQTLLNQYGYSLTIDGDYGAYTHKALGDFQGNHGLTIDYLAGSGTFNALYSNRLVYKLQGLIGANQDNVVGKETLSKCPTLEYGSTGEVVKILQQKLGISADGIFGQDTYRAVINYQSNNGLEVDGTVGKNTWRSLL